MRRRLMYALILFGVSVVAVVVVVIVVTVVLHFPETVGFSPSDITTLIVSISAFGISFGNLFYNIWKEPDLEFDYLE